MAEGHFFGGTQIRIGGAVGGRGHFGGGAAGKVQELRASEVLGGDGIGGGDKGELDVQVLTDAAQRKNVRQLLGKYVQHHQSQKFIHPTSIVE